MTEQELKELEELSITELFPYRPDLGNLNDPKNFLYVVHKHLAMAEPTPVQYDIMDYLWKGPRRLMVEAFRGVGKSHITAIFVCWALFVNPNLKIMVVSANSDRAADFSDFTKKLIADMPLLQHLTPRGRCRDSIEKWDVNGCNITQSPSMKCVGIFGQLTGSRAHIIIPDDIEVPKNSLTQVMRDRISEAIKEFDAVLIPGGVIRYLGTPQTEMSIYNKLPHRGYDMRVWPSEYPKDVDKYKGFLAPIILNRMKPELVGAPTDRFTKRDLEERKLSYGLAGYELQFMLNTELSDIEKYPLKIKDLIITSLDINLAPVAITWASSTELLLNDLEHYGLDGDKGYGPMFTSKEFDKYDGTVMTIDPSGRGSDGTGYAIVKCLKGMLYLMDAGSITGTGYSEEALKALALLAKKYQANTILIESNFGDGMFSQLFSPVLRKIHQANIEEVRAGNTFKEQRICDALEPVMLSHRLVVSKEFLQKDFKQNFGNPEYSFTYQLTRMMRMKGALKHDDTVEAVAYAVSYWVSILGVDVSTTEQDHKDELLTRQLEEFVAYAERLEGFVDNSNWIDYE